MSKVLLINGSPNEHGCTYTALCEVAASLEKNGVETEILYLGKAPVPGCIACGRCRRDGLCSFGGQAVGSHYFIFTAEKFPYRLCLGRRLHDNKHF